MKIRIKGNSIRLRLSKSDIDVLAEKGVCKMQTAFPGGEPFVYKLVLSDLKELNAQRIAEGIQVFFPMDRLDEWQATELVGLSNSCEIDSANKLELLVEKDWQCLSPRDEDESDLFANPNQSAS